MCDDDYQEILIVPSAGVKLYLFEPEAAIDLPRKAESQQRRPVVKHNLNCPEDLSLCCVRDKSPAFFPQALR